VFRRLIIVLLLLPIIPVVIYLTRAAWAHQPTPKAPPAAPAEPLEARALIGPSDLIVRADAKIRPTSAVDVCVARGFVLKAVEVRSIMCRRGSCKAMVRVPGNMTLPVLQRYDFERPPSVLTPGYSC